MKKIFLLLLVLLVLFVGYWFSRDYIADILGLVPKTEIKMYEGSASIYYVDEKGEKEYVGLLKPGESITVRSQNRGPLAMMNVMQLVVPKAVTIFKLTVGKIAEDRPIGVYSRFFTQEEFDQYIAAKLRRPWLPDLKVVIGPNGFTGTGTLILRDKKIPVSGSGIMGVDQKKHGTLFVKFNEIRIGDFRFPRFVLDSLENASNNLMGKGTQVIEILDMRYRYGGIDITFRKTEPPQGLGMGGLVPSSVKAELAKTISIPDSGESIPEDIVGNVAADAMKQLASVTVKKTEGPRQDVSGTPPLPTAAVQKETPPATKPAVPEPVKKSEEPQQDVSDALM